MAALLPGLSLCFDSGLSSPGPICCLAMSLRCADWLYLWLYAHRLLGQGFRCLLACPSLSSWLWLCRFLWVLFFHMVHNLRNGVTPAGSRLVCPRSERRFGMFSLSPLGCFFVLSPFGSGVWVSSHLCATNGDRWCFALSPSRWASASVYGFPSCPVATGEFPGGPH